MINQPMDLFHLPVNKKARITKIEGGYGFIKKLQVMGIREKQMVRIISKQPFRGPITIEVCGCQMTLGQGMAQKILVEVV